MHDTPPLVPAGIDLRDFAFMPLDVLRLRDSELASVEDPEVFRCAVLSWCVAWHQCPAGSLPDDDVQLTRLLGYGRDVATFKSLRANGGMRGWIPCSDGRLYHAVVAAKVLDAWRGKLAQRWRTEAARVKKHNQRWHLEGNLAVRMPDFDEWMSLGCPQGHALPRPQGQSEDVPGDNKRQSPETLKGCPSSVPGETASKGQGEGQGEGEGQREGLREEAPPRKRGVSASIPERPAEVSAQVWADWLSLRKSKKAPVTQTVLDGAVEQAALAGLTLEAFLKVWCSRGSQGLMADWLSPSQLGSAPKTARGSAMSAQEQMAASQAKADRILRSREARRGEVIESTTELFGHG